MTPGGMVCAMSPSMAKPVGIVHRASLFSADTAAHAQKSKNTASAYNFDLLMNTASSLSGASKKNEPPL